ncbi:MobF family relaxase [Arthrobacter crystallopoietes]|uniref:Conjugative relaxase domain-containing protein, TrwC/TraI family n=1 Tax=Crystallibacter crystallopoietes TaxID=37928 RepID=A0A1H0XKM7_9MICC|nr:MobF family relaxase [Arthrobacter crystallopoietes]SDQ03514.1 conjugative relaxase domain-containing protein, TrwC/TraI family [Arthrobacter crystallopoietes]
MMSLHVLSAGTGYLYYTQETASGDELRAGDRQLGDYYTLKGLPPGQWLGQGAAALGVAGNVTEAQMANLFGKGRHPEFEAIHQAKSASGMSAKAAERAAEKEAKLGRRYYEYAPKDNTLAQAISVRESDFERMRGRKPNAAERHRIRATAGAVMFREGHGRPPASKEELGKYITAQLRPQQNAVAGYDLTFTPVKSISVLWALGDADTRRLVEDAQQAALNDSIEYLETHALATRLGTNGIAQSSVKGGLTATAFRHHDSRLGDPNLHTHIVVSNKVQDLTGNWKSIDGKLLHRSAVAVSEHYNTRIQAYLEDHGIRFEARTVNGSKQPVMEVASVPRELITLFSKRSEGIRSSLTELRQAYEEQHGHSPDRAALIKLAQAATLQTRPEKEKPKTLVEQTKAWRQEAGTLYSGKDLDRITGARSRTIRSVAAHIDIDAAARHIVASVSGKRSTWTAQNVMAEANRWAREYALEHGPVPAGTVAAVVSRSLGTVSVRITPDQVHGRFEALTRNAGTADFNHRTDTRYTSTKILEDENLLLRAGHKDVIPAASMQDFDAAVAAYNQAVATGEKSHPLDTGQIDLAREFATSSKLLSVGIGAAGTGKSSSMGLVRAAITHAGGRVIGLAPSAVAAANLGGQLGVAAATTDKFLHTNRYPDHDPDRGTAAGPFRVTPGTVVIVDEAGMQGTGKLADVVRVVEAGGGLVRLIGDDRQLSAVQAGGALRLLINEIGATELETIHRFTSPDEAAASLLLRTPTAHEADPFAWYKANGRIQAGNIDTVEGLAFGLWQTRLNQGDAAVMMAPTNESSQRLSERAQAYRIQTGEVAGAGVAVQLRDGSRAWAGDHIVTRSNDSELKVKRGRDVVKNGDLWTVEQAHEDGSLSVSHLDHGGKIRLPAEYVSGHVHLGYALTTHRAQGMTRDAGIPILDAATSRENAYVAATRGRDENVLFVAVEEGQDRDTVLAAIAGNHSQDSSAHETLATEYDRINSPLTLADQYRYVNDEANNIRMAAMARDVLGPDAEMFITAESWGAVATHLAGAEHGGWDPAGLLQTAAGQRDFDSADDQSAVLAWRLEKIMAKAPELLAQTGERPLQQLTDDQLAKLRTDAEAAARTAREAATGDGPKPAEHWTNRRHGKLTDAELERRIFTTRFSAREQTSINDPAAARHAHQQLRALQDEHRIRTQQLKETRRAAEAAERGSRTQYGTSDPVIAASNQRARGHDVIAARARAEERLRALTPRPVSASDAPDRLPEWLAPSRAAASEYLPGSWREELTARRQVLAARFEERGHLLAAEPPGWAQKLGPVPARPDAARQWRDTAATLEMFRARYNIPETEATPVPERFRNDDIGRQLYDQAVTVSKRSRALTDHATGQDRTLDAINAVERAKNTHAPQAPAQQASDTDRKTHGQEPIAITPPQTEKPRLMTRMEKMVAEQQARKTAEQKPAEQKAPETDAQRQARLAAERAVREQQRAGRSRGDDLGY